MAITSPPVIGENCMRTTLQDAKLRAILLC